jgi:hypothetical protein
MLVAAQAGFDGPLEDHIKEGCRQTVLVEPWPIVRKGRVIKDLFFRGHIEKPPEEPVGINSLDELSLAADRIHGHQKQGFEQAFRRNARTARPTISGVELGRQFQKDRVDRLLQGSNRVVASNPRIDVNDEKHLRLLILASTHPCLTTFIASMLDGPSILNHRTFAASC